jgi:hypothetical protein
MLSKRADDPAGAIIGIGFVGEMLELAAAAFGKVTAWRHAVAGSFDEAAVLGNDVAGRCKGAVLAACADLRPRGRRCG